MKSILKKLLVLSATLCVGAGLGAQVINASAEKAATNSISASVTEINNEELDNGNSFVMVLSTNDYMTADEWSNKDYKWVNAEEIQDRSSTDLSKNNVANASLDQHLDEYNFEEYIFIDGVSLAEFSQTNAYKLIANKRTRPNTVSIDFSAGVLASVNVVEIKAGCQLPTLAYSYLGTGEFSFIEVQEDAAYENRNGLWFEYFEGYEEGVEYNGSKDYFNRFLDTSYKGHTAVSLNAYTDFFARHEIQHETLEGNTALVSVSNTEAGNLMVLNFVNPINAEEFNRLNLRVYINHQIDILTYNAHAITEDSLGPALEAFTVRGGQFTYLTLNSPLYVDDNNQVSTIVFKFVEDCQPQYSDGEILTDSQGKIIRDTFFFVSFNVEKAENTALVSEDSFMVVEEDDSYELTFRFNKYGAFENAQLDFSKVSLNGCLLSEILSVCDEATAEWYPAKGVYQINVSIPKSYTGKAQIKNVNYSFAGNNMSVLEGLTFPNGDVLDKTYTCHLYTGENLLDGELVKEYTSVEVERVKFSFIEGSENLNFSIYFTDSITSSLYNHACEREDWRSGESVADIIGYDKGSTDIFIRGGYKSSLLDNISINGLTIGEWHAYDARVLTNIQVHYGVGLEMNRLDIRFESAAKGTYNRLYDLVLDGNGVTVEISSGLKFMTAKAVEKTQTFVMQGGAFLEQVEGQAIHVYYDGTEVQNGQEITVQTVVSDASIAVVGAPNYNVVRTDENGKKVYTITYDNGTFSFIVTENIVETSEKESGCSSYLGVSSAIAATLCAALIFIVKGEKKNEE